MYQPKHVSIEFKLFALLVNYFHNHQDQNDETYVEIEDLINDKLNALYRHDVYTTYKSDKSPYIKSLARNEYLRLIGLKNDFKWDDTDDLNINSH